MSMIDILNAHKGIGKTKLTEALIVKEIISSLNDSLFLLANTTTGSEQELLKAFREKLFGILGQLKNKTINIKATLLILEVIKIDFDTYFLRNESNNWSREVMKAFSLDLVNIINYLKNSLVNGSVLLESD